MCKIQERPLKDATNLKKIIYQKIEFRNRLANNSRHIDCEKFTEKFKKYFVYFSPRLKY